MKKSRSRPVPSLDKIRTHLDKNGAETHEDDLFRACEFIYDAWEGPDDEDNQIDLALEALTVSPLCSDAYYLLAGHSLRIDDKLSLYEKAVVSGKICIDRTWLADEVDYANSVHARPYLRALVGQGKTLETIGDRPRAVKNYRKVLRHNKSDNMGVRYALISALSMLRDFTAVEKAIHKYDWDDSAFMIYSEVLARLVQDDNGDLAAKLACDAFEKNKHIPHILEASVDPITLEEFDAPYSHGSEEEAFHFRKIFGPAWFATTGATEWLVQTAR